MDPCIRSRSPAAHLAVEASEEGAAVPEVFFGLCPGSDKLEAELVVAFPSATALELPVAEAAVFVVSVASPAPS